jgi:oligopeptide transport system permease protein
MSSLGLILALLAFVTVGPMVWTVDPSVQDVDQIGISPGADRQVTLTTPFIPWEPEALTPPTPSTGNPLGFTLAQSATTQSVRLTWADQDSPRRLYRNLFAPEDTGSFGLPLADLDTPYFEDRLDLQPETYYYTLVALDAAGEESETTATLTIDVTRVISIAQAQERGLIQPDESAEIGQTLKLAWHPLGTDYLGRDMLARLMYGGQVSLFIGLLAPLAFVFLGVIYGSVAGFLGGPVDQGHDAVRRLRRGPAVFAVHDFVQSGVRHWSGRKRHSAYAGSHDYLAVAGTRRDWCEARFCKFAKRPTSAPRDCWALPRPMWLGDICCPTPLESS